MLAVTEKVRAEDKRNNLISSDRIHPDTVGMEVMADIFLKSQGVDRNLNLSFAKWQEKTEIPFGDKNNKRLEIESKLRSLSYIKWDYILNLKPKNQDDFEFLDGKLKTESGEYQSEMIKFYLENHQNREEWEKELKIATDNIYI